MVREGSGCQEAILGRGEGVGRAAQSGLHGVRAKVHTLKENKPKLI